MTPHRISGGGDAEVEQGIFDSIQKRKCSLLPKPCLLLDGLPREIAYEIVDGDSGDWNGLFIDLNMSICKKRLWWTGDMSRTMEGYYGDDYSLSVIYAKSARFEYGETPNAKRK